MNLASSADLPFLVQRVGAALGTEFLDGKFVGLRLLVLGRGVVARFATVA